MADGPRYGFHPLERRGLLLGMDGGQLATMAGGAVVALAAHAAIPGAAGGGSAVLVVAVTVVSALWTRDGRPIAAHVLVAAAWLARGGSRARFDLAPSSGRARVTGNHDGAGGRRAGRGLEPAGIVLTADRSVPGEEAVGIVRDRRAGTWAAVIPVQGCSYCLLDPGEQAQRLEGWRRVLGSLARAGTPVVRVQWVQRSWTGRDRQPPPAEEADPTSPVSSYRHLVESSLAAVAEHQAWLVVVVGSRPSGGGVTALRRELRLLEGQLRAADLRPLPPLGPEELKELLGRPAGASGSGAWPLAVRDGWSSYRADGSCHATYWIAEWPRLEVGPDFLAPLLLTSARAAVSVLMAPVPADRAMRQVRSARTADLADAQLRSRAGFLQSARRERESVGVARREEELADGHQEFRFSGYVTVSAGEEDGLAGACAEVEHAAQSARLEIRRLFGRQAEAYTWTLPLGRGLR